jgi:uncharacterized protein (TIGR02246 family)
MLLHRRTLAALGAAALLGAQLAHAQSTVDKAAISQTLQRYEQALSRSDSAAIVALYTDDGVLLAPDAPAAVGSAALKSAYDATFKAIALNLSFTIDEIRSLGPRSALLRSRSKGTLKVQGNDQPAASVAFKELFVLHRDAQGQWKFADYSFSTAPVER